MCVCAAAKTIADQQVYAATDPASSKLAATVDVTYSRMTRPVVLPASPEDLQDALAQPRVNLGKVLAEMMSKRNGRDRDSEDRSGEQPDEPPNGEAVGAAGAATGATGPPEAEPLQAEPPPPKTPTQDSVPPTPDEHTKVALEELELGERRFRALNPHGCIDYVIESGRVYQVRRRTGAPRSPAVYAVHRHAPRAHVLLDQRAVRQLPPAPAHTQARAGAHGHQRSCLVVSAEHVRGRA